MTVKPMEDVPGSTGNDEVVDNHFNILFVGQPLDVYNYLQIPGNMGDTISCVYSEMAPAPFFNTPTTAENYVEQFTMVYPDITLPS
jgi:hypothetical protein